MSKKVEELERMQLFLLTELVKQIALTRAILTQLEFHGQVDMDVIEDLADEMRDNIESEILATLEEDDEETETAELDCGADVASDDQLGGRV